MPQDGRERRVPARKPKTSAPPNTPASTTSPSVPAPTEQPWSDALTVESGTVKVNAAEGNRFRALGGSDTSNAFNSTMLRQVLGAMWVPSGEERDAEVSRAVGAACAALEAFKPTDEIEGMLAAQAVALHFQAMECFRRAMLPDQLSETTSKLRRDGGNLARGVTDMMEALNRKRGKGPQVVRVERVIVQEGANAIVGNVNGMPAGIPAVSETASQAKPFSVLPDGHGTREGRG
jgi:hypothetical protein